MDKGGIIQIQFPVDQVLGILDRPLGQGLPESWLEQADRVVQIPQAVGVESLNVAVAAAVCLYEAVRQNWTNSKP